MTNFLATPVDISLSTLDTWLDIDLSSHIPANATGAIIQVVNTSNVTSRYYGLRKKGSTDDRHGQITVACQNFCIVGVDSSRKCQGWINNAYVDFHLIGYTEEDATLLTNGIDKSVATAGSWQDIDLSANLPAGAVAAIFEVVNESGSNKEYGFRKKGSTDDRHTDIRAGNDIWFVIGVDSSRKCQGYIEHLDVNCYLLGYLTLGQAETTGIDKSLGTTGSYLDITETDAPTGATGAFGEVFITGTVAYSFAVRENGTSHDFYRDVSRHTDFLTGLDANKKWEGKIQNLQVDFFTLGYFVAGINPKTSSDTGSGVDAKTSLLAAISRSDIGSGIESLGSRLLGASDQGSGTESIAELLATLTKGDTGVGIDALLLLVEALYSGDVGTGTDAFASLLAEVAQSDSGSGIDLLKSRLFDSCDQGSGADSLAELLATLSESDSGAGTESVTELLAAISRSDTGSGTEAAIKEVFIFLLLKLLHERVIDVKASQGGRPVNIALSQEEIQT